MASAGRVLLIPKGDYNGSTTYNMLDFVYYDGASYVCKKTSTGNAPTNTEYWQILANASSGPIGDFFQSPNVATVESSATASKAYSKDDWLIFGGYLCKATQDITAGATIAVGTNIAHTTLEELFAAHSGGHLVLTSTDTVMPQRSKLKFMNSDVEDDAVNGVTIVTPKGGGSGPVDIVVTTLPAKTSYTPGEALDYTGMRVDVLLSDGTLREVTEYVTCSPSEGTLATLSMSSVTITYATFTKSFSITVTPPVYGAEWDGTSTTLWSRTDAAENFTDPVPYVAGASSYGSPFDTISPWKDMVKSERTGGTMVSIPKFYYKLAQNGAGMKIQITPGDNAAWALANGYKISPAHMDRGDGKGERDTIYIGRYHCHADDYKSKTGGLPKVQITRSDARTAINNLGSNIWQSDFATRFTIWLLYIVEFADWNSQEKIGYGCAPDGSTSAVRNMGYTDSMPYHTGTDRESRTTYGGTQYRNIEGLWDNCYDWMDGCYYNASGLNVILKPADFSDTENGILVGLPTGGYPSEFTVEDVSGLFACFIPTTSSGSNTTYSCDYWDFSASNPCLCVGGYYSQGLNRGLFYVGYGSAANSGASHGCRLLELP